MKKYFQFLNIVLGLVIASQFRVWWSGPFSGYLFSLTFIGLALVCLGSYGATRWGPVRGKTPAEDGSSADHAFQAGRTSNGMGIVRKLLVLAEIGIGLALIFEYELIVGSLLR